MAVAVVLLWGCLLGERIIVRHAREQQAEALRDVRRLRERFRSQPAGSPRDRFRRPARPAVG